MGAEDRNRPDAATLHAWARRYKARRRELRAALTASYTPEQRALIAQITEASRQIRLCGERLLRREAWGGQGHRIAWPDDPDQGQG